MTHWLSEILAQAKTNMQAKALTLGLLLLAAFCSQTAIADDLDAKVDSIALEIEDLANILGNDSLPLIEPFDKFAGFNQWEERDVIYNPDPTRAVWMSALFPGLGQVYNRRFWKLPIIAGGYLGLAYASSWNNTMLTDYTRAYRDIMDSDPETKSYMDFFPPTIKEEDLDKTWLTNLLKSRKDYFRRNRDLCIISMVGVYFLAMVDAYVDASLSHFDITPDLTVDVAPTLMRAPQSTRPAIGLTWAFNF